MTSNEKTLNFKVVDLVESYKFCTEFIYFRVHTRNYNFFENKLTLTTVGHCGCRYSRSVPTVVAHGSLTL
jgi:hypothetical protein